MTVLSAHSSFTLCHHSIRNVSTWPACTLTPSSLTNVDEVERRSGIDLFALLPDTEENLPASPSLTRPRVAFARRLRR